MNHQNPGAPDLIPCEVCAIDTRCRAEIDGSRFPLCIRHGGLHHRGFKPTPRHVDYWQKLEERPFGDLEVINGWRMSNLPRIPLTA